MSRKNSRPGKREREARKRHRRVWLVVSGNVTVHASHVYFQNHPEAEAVPLKLGRKHYRRWMRRSLSVADFRNVGGERALESARRTLPKS